MSSITIHAANLMISAIAGSQAHIIVIRNISHFGGPGIPVVDPWEFPS